jgi:ligand-binding sensor domain-containing protein
MLLKVRNIYIRFIIASIMFSFPQIALLSQNYTVNTFTTKDGLPHNNIKSIVQDKTGFLWIATWDGLSRFDGYEFKNYFHRPDDSTSLPFFLIIKVCVDINDNLWVLDNSGNLALYNRIEDNFIRFDNIRDSLYITDITVDKSENLWMIGQNGVVLKYEYEIAKFTQLSIKDQNNNILNFENATSKISFDNRGNFWIRVGFSRSPSQIYKISVQLDEFNKPKFLCFKGKYLTEPDRSFYNHPYNFIPSYNFYESFDNKVWMLSNLGQFLLDTIRMKFNEYNYKIPEKDLAPGDQFLWTKIKDSIYFYNPGSKEVIQISSEPFKFIEALYIDSFNTLWMGSMTEYGDGQGLTRYTMTSSFFKNVLLKKDKTSEDVAVFSVLKDKYRNIWVGGRNLDYIACLKPNGEKLKYYKDEKEIWKSNNHPRSMVEDSNGIWIGYFDRLLLRFDYSNHKFTKKVFNSDLTADYKNPGQFRRIIFDHTRNIIVGSNGLYKIDPNNWNVQLLWGPDNYLVYSILKDNYSGYWIGDTRLIHLDSLSREERIVEINKSKYSIVDICQGNNDELWLALLGGGICRYNINTGIKEFFTTENGLSNNTAYRILRDLKGNIWISTNHGITSYDSETRQFRSFGTEDGLKIEEFNSGAAFYSSDGEMFFGGMGGFVRFYPDSLKMTENSSTDHRLLLIDLKVSGEIRHLPKPLNESDSIVLKKGENNFSLSFSSTDFVNSGKIRYRYRLSGVNRNWITTDSHNRNINYSNLKPGRYSLQIQATNLNGEWTAGKKIVFGITPYIYQTMLFKISVSVLILILIGGIIIMYIRQLKQRESQKQDTLRLQSLRGQMNPHFIFNSLNSINYFISNNDKLSANRYIADFSRLIRSILSNLGNDYVPFKDELNSIKDYLNIEHLRFGDKFGFELNTDTMNISDFEVFPGLVQPFIENAIWHGVRALENRKGFISVKFYAPGQDRIKCMVTDDGIGRGTSLKRKSYSENHKSKGIGIVLERLQIISKLRGISYNLEITDLCSDLPETGTKVEIDIPVKII